LNKTEGIWWSLRDRTDVDKEHKEFAFVENSNVTATPYTARLSTLNGTNVVVQCDFQFRPLEGTGSVQDGDFKSGECFYLPLFTWIRVIAADIITNPDSAHWGLTYTSGEVDNPVLSNFLIKAICYLRWHLHDG
jgi:hypothetical protein